jgi:hypothetical protein
MSESRSALAAPGLGAKHCSRLSGQIVTPQAVRLHGCSLLMVADGCSAKVVGDLQHHFRNSSVAHTSFSGPAASPYRFSGHVTEQASAGECEENLVRLPRCAFSTMGASKSKLCSTAAERIASAAPTPSVLTRRKRLCPSTNPDTVASVTKTAMEITIGPDPRAKGGQAAGIGRWCAPACCDAC